MGEEDATTPAEQEQASASEELKELHEYIAETAGRIAMKTEMRNHNTSLTPKTEEFFVRMDSNLKKNTAFVKKVKQFTATQMEGLLKECSSLNLTKYISEIGQALVEAKLKMTDVMPAVQLCNKFHEIYSEFSGTFFENWQKVLTMKPTEAVANPSKMRVDLRFFAELVLVGIIPHRPGLALLGGTLMALINQDKEDFSNLNIILSFCKNCGDEFAGLVSTRMAALAVQHQLEIPKSTFLPADKQHNLRNLLRDYYHSLCGHVKRQHKLVTEAERTNRYMLSSKGEVTDQKRERLEHLQAGFEKLIASTQTLSDLLGEPMPALPKPVESNEGHIIAEDISMADQDLDPWGDDETKAFYLSLPDLRDILPNFAPKEQDLLPAEAPMSEDVLDTEIQPEQLQLDETIVPVKEAEEETTTATVTNTTATTTTTTTTTPDEEAAGTANTTAGVSSSSAAAAASDQVNYHSKAYYDTFVKNLNKCVNTELIDSAAIEFLLHMNTKNNRKKISRSIFGVQRTRLDLLPFLSRFVAILTLVSKDVSNELVKLLNNEFKYHVREKDQIKIESKIKVVRFIGELVKFGLYPRIDSLFFLKVLLQDFHHHNIEMACALLEVCGVYLYNCKESRLRTNIYLEQMLRLKTVNAFDPRHVALIENAYYVIKSPEGRKVQQKVRTPVQRYIRHLVFEELNKATVDKVIRALRTLNWDDKETADYVVRCLTKAHSIRYHLIRCLADLVSGLSSYQDRHMVRVIDAVFEDVRAGLEIYRGSEQFAQRRVAMVKYLGEMYIHRLVEKGDVFNTLYTILSLGVNPWNQAVVSATDPPKSLFRLKLVCVLLDTCGEYFLTSANSRKRLEYFLVFFQQYYWFKKSHPVFGGVTGEVGGEGELIEELGVAEDLFPILTDYMYKDTLKKVRPQLKHYKSYEEACEAVVELQVKLFPNIAAGPEEEEEKGKEVKTVGGGGGGALDAVTEQQEESDLSGDETSEIAGDDSEEDQEEDDEGSDNDEEEDEEGEDDDEDDDDDDLGDEEEEDREQENAKPKEEEEKSAEDLEFESMFERMTMDSYQERAKETTLKPAVKEIPIPVLGKQTKKTYENLQKAEEPEEEAGVAFVLMTRGGKAGKQQLKAFSAPADSQLAVNLKLQEQKRREEHENVKRYVQRNDKEGKERDYNV